MKARLASANPHKLVELRHALPGWEIELIDDTAFPPETGSTYEENARGKAEHGRTDALGDAWVIGEDSGIEAAGLDGRPGLASARWADDGVARLLEELEGALDRRARYVCVIVAIGPEGNEIVVEGTLEGTIATGRRGEEGFGYDPIFVPDGECLTVAQLGGRWKRVSSHRARAAAALAAVLGIDHLVCSAMEPNEALAELLDLSSQVRDVAILGESGFVLASSGTPERGEQLARVAADLVAAAADVRAAGDVSRIEVQLDSTSVFVVREGGRTVIATTVPQPTAGLVAYDLRTALRRLGEMPAPKPTGRAKRKRAADA